MENVFHCNFAQCDLEKYYKLLQCRELAFNIQSRRTLPVLFKKVQLLIILLILLFHSALKEDDYHSVKNVPSRTPTYRMPHAYK